MPQPPRLAAWIVGLAAGDAAREHLLGDLDEQFQRRAARDPRAARRWYRRQAAQTVRHLGLRRRRAAVPVGRAEGDFHMRDLVADARFALRQLVRQPFYAVVAVLSLTTAIAANGLVFGFVDHLVFNPFHVPDPDRLVSIGLAFPRLGQDEGFVEQHSPAEIDDFRQAPALAHVTAFDLGNRAVSNGSTAERVFTVLAVDDPVAAVGLAPTLGRGFTAEELAPNGPAVAVISHALWTRLFGGDPAIIGRHILVNAQPRTVVGVTAADGTLLGADLWIPRGATPSSVPRNARQFTVVARLAPGATLAQANAELRAIAARTTTQYGARYPEYEGWRVRAVPWTEAITGQLRGPARLLLGVGLLVLLIACVNLATLTLARVNRRRREIAVRYALGAGGWHILRLLLIESLAIAAVSAVLGLAIARLAMRPLVTMLPAMASAIGTPAIDLRTAIYAALVGLAGAVAMSVAPAWHARRAAPQDALRDTAGAGGGRQRFRRMLVAAELTLAVVLLVGAGLLLVSYARIQNIDPGFRTDRMITMRLTLAGEQYGGSKASQFFHELVERLQALPEVDRAAAASQFPPDEAFTTPFQVAGAPASTDTLPTALVTLVTPGYFQALGMRLQSGRTLDDRDRAGAPTALVVNEAFARRYLDGHGRRRLLVTQRHLPADIVGIVADAHNDTLLRPAQPEIFVTIDQGPWSNQLFLLVRTTVDPVTAMPAVRRTLAALDPDQPLYLIQTMDQALARSLATQRIGLSLVGGFAAAALLIACVGVYGVVWYWVATRTREIGIRMALGATSRHVVRLVAGETVRLIVVGAVLGAGGGIVLGVFARPLLYRTSAADPVALGGVALALVLVALAAAYLPSRRASGVDPMQALRAD